MTTLDRALFIPVILGTGRRGRLSEPVANFVFAELLKREGIESDLIDVRAIAFQIEGPADELKDSAFAAKMARARRAARVS